MGRRAEQSGPEGRHGAAGGARHFWPLCLVALLAVRACDPPQVAPRGSSSFSGSEWITPVGPSSKACADVSSTTRQGVSEGVTLWALLFPTRPEISAGDEIKIVLRITGSGALSIDATGPGGATVGPAWGPEIHSGSNFDHPGDEWGTGWVFPTAGCWVIDAKRTGGAAYLPLQIAERQGRSASAGPS